MPEKTVQKEPGKKPAPSKKPKPQQEVVVQIPLSELHALRKMNIPTVIFINKIDQAGVDLQSVVQSVRDKLSADIIIKQTVSLSPEIVLEENTDIEAWDAVIENNDKLLEKYIAGEPIFSKARCSAPIAAAACTGRGTSARSPTMCTSTIV